MLVQSVHMRYPSDDFLNSFVDSHGVARDTELDLGQPVASLWNSRRFRIELEGRSSVSSLKRLEFKSDAIGCPRSNSVTRATPLLSTKLISKTCRAFSDIRRVLFGRSRVLASTCRTCTCNSALCHVATCSALLCYCLTHAGGHGTMCTLNSQIYGDPE